MTESDAIARVRYVVDDQGNRTEIILPLSAWEALLALWKRLNDAVEAQEDRAILEAWLEKRAAGEAETVSLEDLERELAAAGLLPG